MTAPPLYQPTVVTLGYAKKRMIFQYENNNQSIQAIDLKVTLGRVRETIITANKNKC